MDAIGSHTDGVGLKMDTFFQGDDSVLKTYQIDGEAVTAFEREVAKSNIGLQVALCCADPCSLACGVALGLLCSPCIYTYSSACHEPNGACRRSPQPAARPSNLSPLTSPHKSASWWPVGTTP